MKNDKQIYARVDGSQVRMIYVYYITALTPHCFLAAPCSIPP